MKLETHINLKEVGIKQLLATVLSLQIALWTLMGLNVLGVSIPIVQPLIGLVYLTFVPGTLILAALRLRNLGIVEAVLYAVGLSITVVMSIGLVNTIVFSAVNVIKPLSSISVTSSVSLVVLVLCAVAYFRNRTTGHVGYSPGSGKRLNLIPLFNTEISVPLTPTLFLVIIPFITVFSTYLVNTYNVPVGQFALYLILGAVVLLIAFDTFIPSKLYPLAVFVIALSLLFQETLISAFVTGWDILGEWSLANSVLSAGVWDPSLLNHYDGMLSIVAVAPVYSIISSLDLIWVFKIVYPAIFALVPLGLYQIFRRQVDEKIAFLSSFFFMSIVSFFVEMTQLGRQEIAEFFFVLLILLLVSKEMNKTIQSALFIVFSLSLVVSHYGLTYIALFFLFVMWLVLTVAPIDGSKPMMSLFRTELGIRKDNEFFAPSPKSSPRSAVTILCILILFIASFAWYTFTAQQQNLLAVSSLGSQVVSSIQNMFDPTYSQAVNIAAQQAHAPQGSILHQVVSVADASFYYLNQFFILAGVCVVIFLKKHRFKFQRPYVVISAVALGFLIVNVAVPYLSRSLNWSRVFQITSILLAPFLAVGFIKIGEAGSAAKSVVKSKLGFGSSQANLSRLTRLLALYLVLYLFFSTSFVLALAEGTQTIALSNTVDDMQFNHQEIVGVSWLANNSGVIPLSGRSVTIFHYFNGVRYNDTKETTNATGQITLTQPLSSAGQYAYHATFAGDASYYPVTSGVVTVKVGSSQTRSQTTSQAITYEGSNAITLAASTTTPAIGQPVTFTTTLTGRQIIYGDEIRSMLIQALVPPAQGLMLQNTSALGSFIFLGTWNIEHNQVETFNSIGVNREFFLTNVTPLVSDKSLIYSNGGANAYS